MQGTGAARGQPTNPATDRTTPSTAPGWLLPAARRCRRRVCPHLQCAVPAPRPLHCMETGQGMQATCARRRQPTASLLRTATRPELHQGGFPFDPAGAVCVPTECALLCPPRDPTAPWTPSSTCRLSASGRRQATASPTRTAPRPKPHHEPAGIKTLSRPCNRRVSAASAHCRTLSMDPPHRGYQVEYASYPHRQGSALQLGTGRATLLTESGSSCQLTVA